MSNDIVVVFVDLKEEGCQNGVIRKVVFPARLVVARTAFIIGVVVEVVVLLFLGDPVGLGEIGCVSLKRAVDNKFSPSGLEPSSCVVLHKGVQTFQIRRTDEVVSVHVNF